MQVPKRRSLDVLSISALDIFASALGVFILMAILMFPYYLKQPALEEEEAGADQALALAAAYKGRLEDTLVSAEAQENQARAALDDAKARLALAKSLAVTPPEVPAEIPSIGDPANPMLIQDLDLVVVFDATRSMRKELKDLQASLLGLINVLSRLSESLRIGIVAFKDQGDVYLTRAFPLRVMGPTEVNEITRFVRDIEADGGGDRPEPVDEALQVAIDMTWRNDAQGRIILVGDAEPRAIKRSLELAETYWQSPANKRLPRVISTIFTGDNLTARAFYERLAEVGRGDSAVHNGSMIESVLLSILPKKGA